MAELIKSNFKVSSSNSGAMFTTGPGSLMSIKKDIGGAINISGGIGYSSQQQTPSFQYYGINLAGLEFSNYAFSPKRWCLNHWAHNGANIVRIPFRWEYIQPVLLGQLDAAFLAEMKDIVAEANALGLIAILDLHNYGTYSSNSANFTSENMVDVWTKIAAEFDGYNVQYELMNEPGTAATASTQASIYNACIDAIRGISATKIIHVPLLGSSKIYSVITDYSSYISLLTSLDQNCLIHAHTYADNDGSGTSAVPRSDVINICLLEDYAQWLRIKGLKMFIGEIGTGSQYPLGPRWTRKVFDKLSKNSDVFVGFTWWADGGSWDASYFNLATNQNTGWDYETGDIIRDFMESGNYTYVSPVNDYQFRAIGGSPSYTQDALTGGAIMMGAASDRTYYQHPLLAHTLDVVINTPSNVTLSTTTIIVTRVFSNSSLRMLSTGALQFNGVTLGSPLSRDADHHIRIASTPNGTSSLPITIYIDGVQVHTGAVTTISDFIDMGIGGTYTSTSDSYCFAGGLVKSVIVRCDTLGAPSGVELLPFNSETSDSSNLIEAFSVKSGVPSFYSR